MSVDYDAILLTPSGEWATRYSAIDLYGWDVESLLVLNFDAIDTQEYMKL